MKVGLTASMLLLLSASCISDAGEARFRGAVETFDPCTTVCGAELTHDRGTLTLELRDASGVVIARNIGVLTEVGAAMLASLEAGLTEGVDSLLASECTDCDPSIEVGWVEGRLVTYGTSSAPPALADLHTFVEELEETLAACTMSSDVSPSASCTPTALP